MIRFLSVNYITVGSFPFQYITLLFNVLFQLTAKGSQEAHDSQIEINLELRKISVNWKQCAWLKVRRVCNLSCQFIQQQIRLNLLFYKSPALP